MAPTPTSLKYVSLCVLCLQNSLYAILLRLSRVGDFPKFNTSTAVVMGEILKLLVSAALIVLSPAALDDKAKSVQGRVHVSSLQIIFNRHEVFRVSVPALLYVIQNNLQYVAASNLDAASFQVLYQLKILTTAVFSVVLLRKNILPMQWGAIVLLMVGVALVQLDDSGTATTSPQKQPPADQNTMVGLLAVLAACMCSGFAGVYFEKILKNSGAKGSIWERNVQMGLISIVLAAIGLYWNDYEYLMTKGFFYGYRPVVWAAIAFGAFGGLLTAVVVKYADNILKAFATSIAIVLSVVMSIFLFDKIPTLQFIVGAVVVNVSVYLYGTAPSRQSPQQLKPNGTSGASAESSVLPHIVSKKVAP